MAQQLHLYPEISDAQFRQAVLDRILDAVGRDEPDAAAAAPSEYVSFPADARVERVADDEPDFADNPWYNGAWVTCRIFIRADEARKTEPSSIIADYPPRDED